jgi:hypothetical protein
MRLVGRVEIGNCCERRSIPPPASYRVLVTKLAERCEVPVLDPVDPGRMDWASSLRRWRA